MTFPHSPDCDVNDLMIKGKPCNCWNAEIERRDAEIAELKFNLDQSRKAHKLECQENELLQSSLADRDSRLKEIENQITMLYQAPKPKNLTHDLSQDGVKTVADAYQRGWQHALAELKMRIR